MKRLPTEFKDKLNCVKSGQQGRVRRVLCLVLVALLAAAPAFSHVSVTDSLPDGTAGCHDDGGAQGYHCHETDSKEQEELLIAGLVVVGVIWIVRAARRGDKNDDKSVAEPNEGRTRLEDLLREESMRLDVLPVRNSFGKFDGAQVRVTFRF